MSGNVKVLDSEPAWEIGNKLVESKQILRKDFISSPELKFSESTETILLKKFWLGLHHYHFRRIEYDGRRSFLSFHFKATF